ncbi:MAG: hypothetical protein V3T77_06905, partial [Planctomycetota bacterium]
MSNLVLKLDAALNERRWNDYEEIWLDAIEAETEPMAEYLQAAHIALAQGHGERAGLALALLAPQAEKLPLAERREFFETLVLCLPNDREQRDSLVEVYQEEYKDTPGFAAYLKAADLQRAADPCKALQLFHKMVKFVPGTFVFHRSGWGVGEIKEVRPLEGTAVIDFIDKTGHLVQVGAIPDICDPLPENHYLVLAWRDPERLRSLAEGQPLELIKMVLRTSQRPLPLVHIREALVGTAIPGAEWSKWWARQRNAMKKDPEIAVAGKKTPEYFLLEGPEGTVAALERRMAGADLKRRLRLLREAVAETKVAERHILEPFFAQMKRNLLRGDGSLPLRMEILLFLLRHGPDSDDLPPVLEMLSDSDHPGDTINLLARTDDQQRVLELLREQGAEEWEQLRTDLLLGADSGPRDYLISLLIQDGRESEIDYWAKEIQRLPKKAPLFYMWLLGLVCRRDLRRTPCLEGVTGVSMYIRAISMLEDMSVRAQQDKSSILELHLRRYRQRLSAKPYTLLGQAIAYSDSAPVRDLYRQIETSHALSVTSRQSL